MVEEASTNFVSALEAGEMMSLEDEISHLQKENSRIESQLSRMKGDVSSTEGEAVAEDKVGELLVCTHLITANMFYVCTILSPKYCRNRMN